MKTPIITRELFQDWSEEDLRTHYEFLLEREDRLTTSQQKAFEIVSDMLMEMDAERLFAEEGLA